LSDVRVVRQWGGWLDKCMDGVPVVSPVDEVPGLYLAAGFSGHGFGIAPAVSLCLSQLILGEKTAVDVSPLAYHRFKTTK
ncbi:MAG: FAD-binding oxidoreductase, partial [Clostridium sp.]|nr:FAD-binding oxidoreductase [Clostridium sp.]